MVILDSVVCLHCSGDGRMMKMFTSESDNLQLLQTENHQALRASPSDPGNLLRSNGFSTPGRSSKNSLSKFLLFVMFQYPRENCFLETAEVILCNQQCADKSHITEECFHHVSLQFDVTVWTPILCSSICTYLSRFYDLISYLVQSLIIVLLRTPSMYVCMGSFGGRRKIK